MNTDDAEHEEQSVASLRTILSIRHWGAIRLQPRQPKSTVLSWYLVAPGCESSLKTGETLTIEAPIRGTPHVRPGCQTTQPLQGLGQLLWGLNLRLSPDRLVGSAGCSDCNTKEIAMLSLRSFGTLPTRITNCTPCFHRHR
jgi:hypothetical protein